MADPQPKRKIILDMAYKIVYSCLMKKISLREYLEITGKSVTGAADELGVSRVRLSQLVNGKPAGRKLALKIQKWSGGVVKATDLFYGEGA